MSLLNNSTNQNTVSSTITVQNTTPYLTAMGGGAMPSATGAHNTALGWNAGNLITSGSNTTAIGFGTLSKLITQSGDTAVGFNCLTNCTASNNTAVGYEAGDAVTSGTHNVFMGDSAGVNQTTANQSTAIGSNALKGVLAGAGAASNTAVGYLTLSTATGGSNTAIGAQGLEFITSGSQNIAVGFNAGSNYTSSESNNIMIGAVGVVGESNTIRIGTQGTGAGQQSGAHIVGTLHISGAIETKPVSSATATTGFGTSLTAGTAVQNTLGYDILLNISVSVNSATGASLTLGVDSISTPTTNTVTSAFSSLIALPPINFTAIIPNNYYVLVNSSGTIAIGSILCQACPI